MINPPMFHHVLESASLQQWNTRLVDRTLLRHALGAEGGSKRSRMNWTPHVLFLNSASTHGLMALDASLCIAL
jgi:hypothetical protein